MADGDQSVTLGDVPPWLTSATQTTTFAGNMALPVHRWFRYSAGFSAQWAAQEIAANRARHVVDPFAGSGTTLLAAQGVGAESAGIDVHPLVSRIARAKLLWGSDAGRLHARAERVRSVARDIDVTNAPVAELTYNCFPPDVLTALLRLRAAISATSAGEPADELMWLALLGILRRCSPVGTAQWQYVLPQKRKARVADPAAAFEEQVRRMCADMTARQAQIATPADARFIEADVRTTDAVETGWADLVLASPPYANNFDYADATRLEMTFLGEVTSWKDLKPLRRLLIRSCSHQMTRYEAAVTLRESPELATIRAELAEVHAGLAAAKEVKAGKKAYDSMVVAYFHDLATAWLNIRRMTRPGGSVCFVVGDSAPYGVHVPVERWLGRLAVAAGFDSWSFEKVRDRNTRWENRKHRVPLHEGRLWVR